MCKYFAEHEEARTENRRGRPRAQADEEKRDAGGITSRPSGVSSAATEGRTPLEENIFLMSCLS